MNTEDDEKIFKLKKLAGELESLLSNVGVVSLSKGDFWLDGINVNIPSVEILIFQRINFTPEVAIGCSNLLSNYPESFRIRFVEAGADGRPLSPFGGLQITRYGPEPI